MKKFILLMSIITLLSLVACAAPEHAEEVETKATDAVTTVEETQEKNETEEYPTLEEAIEIYKQDIYADVPGYNLDNSGYLTTPDWDDDNFFIHFDARQHGYKYNYLARFIDSTYVVSGNKITKYCFGESVGTIVIDENVIFCGSNHEGFFFRVEDKVLFVNYKLHEKCISTGVSFVVAVNYAHSSDFHDQTLLFMEDGTFKVYIDGKPDLVEIWFEGGHGGTCIK